MVPNGWLHKQIGEIASIQVGRDLVEDKYSEISTTEYKYPVYSNTVENKGLYGFYNFPEYSGNAITIVGRGVGLGKAFARCGGESFGAIGRLLVLTPKNNSFDVIFFANYINFALRIHNESGGIPQLPGASLSKYFVMLPPLAEQQKIAQILSTWDKAIAVTEQLLANSQQQKKALMQQLLTGKKRLLDENGARFEGEWEEFSLGNIAKVYQPKTISQSQLSFDGYPVYGANGIIGYYCDFNHELEQIAVTCRGSTCGVVNWTMPKSWITGNAMVINVDNNSAISKKFLFYVLSNADLKYLITGSGQPQITGDIKNHVVHLASFKEQKVIAQVLTIADQEIEVLQRKLDCLQQEKKALMQQLLTGKRRVKVAA